MDRELPIQAGERVVVAGWHNIVTRVVGCAFNPSEARWTIELDWGAHGRSRVYDTDEGRTWYRYQATN